MIKICNQLNKILMLLLFLVILSMFFSVNTHADEQVFSVTVPMQLSIDMNPLGQVTTASNAVITNNSIAPVKVTNVFLNVNDGWSIDNYNKEFGNEKTGSKKIGISINGYTFSSDGELSNFSSVINTGDSMPINYDAKIPAQTIDIINENIASIVFTVDWEGEAPVLHSVSFVNGENGNIIGGETTIENIVDGTTIAFPSVDPSQGYAFEHWVDVNTNEIKGENSPITSSMTLKPVLKQVINPIQVVNGTTINIETGTILEYTGSGGEVTILTSIIVDGVEYPITSIADNAYSDKGITSITIPNGIEHIGTNAFSYNNLDSLYLPNSVTYIGSEAFRNDYINKNEITIDNYPGAVTIGIDAFINNHKNGKFDIEKDIKYTQVAPNQMRILGIEDPEGLEVEDSSMYPETVINQEEQNSDSNKILEVQEDKSIKVSDETTTETSISEDTEISTNVPKEETIDIVNKENSNSHTEPEPKVEPIENEVEKQEQETELEQEHEIDVEPEVEFRETGTEQETGVKQKKDLEQEVELEELKLETEIDMFKDEEETEDETL